MLRRQLKSARSKFVSWQRSFAVLGAAVACTVVFAMSGCCGPMGCGPGCYADGCYDCDGAGLGQPLPRGPIDAIHHLRKEMICGSGCGETYVGEWISTPPNCPDPCCGDQFTGGGYTARPFCWERGTILNGLFGSLYGIRFCDGCSQQANECWCGFESCGGCGDAGCGGGCADGACGDEYYMDSGYVSDGYVEAPMSTAPVNAGGDCGCASCGQSTANSGSVRMAQQIRRPQPSQRQYQQTQMRQAQRISSTQIQGTMRR
ncbi:MAG: hypothetical protein AAF456_09420 [Planctomycetota bacterium]